MFGNTNNVNDSVMLRIRSPEVEDHSNGTLICHGGICSKSKNRYGLKKGPQKFHKCPQTLETSVYRSQCMWEKPHLIVATTAEGWSCTAR